jgi:rRNA maturation endonuclease Nob1
VERPRDRDDRQLVRCLDCGTVYPLPLGLQEADACPQCGGVGWIALAALKRVDEGKSS